MGRNSSYKSTRAVAVARSFSSNNDNELENIKDSSFVLLQKMTNQKTSKSNNDQSANFIQNIAQNVFGLSNQNYAYAPFTSDNQNDRKEEIVRVLQNIQKLKNKPNSLVALYNPELLGNKKQMTENTIKQLKLENNNKPFPNNNDLVEFATIEKESAHNKYKRPSYAYEDRVKINNGFVEYQNSINQLTNQINKFEEKKNPYEITSDDKSIKTKEYRKNIAYRDLYRKLAWDEAMKDQISENSVKNTRFEYAGPDKGFLKYFMKNPTAEYVYRTLTPNYTYERIGNPFREINAAEKFGLKENLRNSFAIVPWDFLMKDSANDVGWKTND